MAGHCHEQAKIRDRAREEKEAEERIEDAIWAPAAVELYNGEGIAWRTLRPEISRMPMRVTLT
jgi:hypothetical protein